MPRAVVDRGLVVVGEDTWQVSWIQDGKGKGAMGVGLKGEKSKKGY